MAGGGGGGGGSYRVRTPRKILQSNGQPEERELPTVLIWIGMKSNAESEENLMTNGPGSLVFQ